MSKVQYNSLSPVGGYRRAPATLASCRPFTSRPRTTLATAAWPCFIFARCALQSTLVQVLLPIPSEQFQLSRSVTTPCMQSTAGISLLQSLTSFFHQSSTHVLDAFLGQLSAAPLLRGSLFGSSRLGRSQQHGERAPVELQHLQVKACAQTVRATSH